MDVFLPIVDATDRTQKPPRLLCIKVDFLTYGEVKSFPHDIYEEIKERGVDQCYKNLKKEAAYHKAEKQVPWQDLKDAEQTYDRERIHKLGQKG